LKPHYVFLLICFVPWLALGQDSVGVCVRHVVTPAYPSLARGSRLEGAARVDVEIAADGKVTSTKAEGPEEILNHAAETNVRQWVFSPSSSRTSSKLTITFVFMLRLAQEGTPLPSVVFDLPDRVEVTDSPMKIVSIDNADNSGDAPPRSNKQR